MEKLRNLKTMLDEGLITQQDYDISKKEILSEITKSPSTLTVNGTNGKPPPPPPKKRRASFVEHSSKVDSDLSRPVVPSKGERKPLSRYVSSESIVVPSSLNSTRMDRPVLPVRGKEIPVVPVRGKIINTVDANGFDVQIKVDDVDVKPSPFTFELKKTKIINTVDANGFDVQIEVDIEEKTKLSKSRFNKSKSGRHAEKESTINTQSELSDINNSRSRSSRSRRDEISSGDADEERKTKGGVKRRAPVGRFDKEGETKRGIRESQSTFQAYNFGYQKGKAVDYAIALRGPEYNDNTKIKDVSYEIDVNESGKTWKVFRLYHQFQELDKLLKKKKKIPRSSKELPPKNRGKEVGKIQFLENRQGYLELYLNNLLTDSNIAESQYIFNFLGPFQIGDIKPNT